MNPAITIRSERSADGPAITDIVRRAYAGVPYSDHREHLMIARLRETDAYVPALSLLAEIDGKLAGHILLTQAQVRSPRSSTTILALAPLSIAPEFQRQGVGKRLVLAAHEQAAALGFGAVLVVGTASYYPQFGYRRLSRYPIRLPFAAPDENCMILPLRPGALDEVEGQVDYASGWLDH